MKIKIIYRLVLRKNANLAFFFRLDYFRVLGYTNKWLVHSNRCEIIMWILIGPEGYLHTVLPLELHV